MVEKAEVSVQTIWDAPSLLSLNKILNLNKGWAQAWMIWKNVSKILKKKMFTSMKKWNMLKIEAVCLISALLISQTKVKEVIWYPFWISWSHSCLVISPFPRLQSSKESAPPSYLYPDQNFIFAYLLPCYQLTLYSYILCFSVFCLWMNSYWSLPYSVNSVMLFLS